MAEYPQTSTNKIGRLPNRGAYDFATVHHLVNTTPVLHLSFNDPAQPFPVILPMLGATGSFEKQDADPETSAQDVYVHGYVSGRVFEESKRAGGENEEEEGLPVSLCATTLDGLVLSLTPFHNSCNYRSAVLYGRATLITSPPERLYALRLITNNLLPSRWENSRVPPTNAELTSTSVLKIRVQSASAKIRAGGPSEDRSDLKDEALRKRVWTGVVPSWVMWGEPVAGEENGREEVEGYIERWRVGENGRGRREAFGAVGKK